jgi:hypothetical protein
MISWFTLLSMSAVYLNRVGVAAEGVREASEEEEGRGGGGVTLFGRCM